MLGIRIRIWIRMFLVLPDPNPDPFGSWSSSGSGSFHHQSKIFLKTLISSAFWLLNDFLSLVRIRIRIRIYRISMFRASRIRLSEVQVRIRGSGSLPKCHGSPTLVVTFVCKFLITCIEPCWRYRGSEQMPRLSQSSGKSGDCGTEIEHTDVNINAIM